MLTSITHYRTPVVFPRAGISNPHNFDITVNSDCEDAADVEDVIEIEGSPIDFPRVWNDVEDEAPPVLIRVPRGDLFRRGLPSYVLSTSVTSLWQLLSPEFVFPGITSEFSGTFDGTSSAGGLVLIPCDHDFLQATSGTSMSASASQKLTLIVSNPMERSYRTLPQMVDLCKEMTCKSLDKESNLPPPQVMGIFMDSSTGIYHIPVIQRLVAPVESDVVAMQVYDSGTEAWRIFGQWRLREPKLKEILEVTYVEGTFYFLVHDRGQGRDEILFLKDEEWEAIGLLPAGYTLSNPTIFEHSGFLMLGGFLPKEQVMKESDLQRLVGETVATEELRFGYVWHHDFVEMKWHHYCKVPFYWSHNLHQRSPGSPSCTLQIVAGGNYICVASSNGKIAQFDMACEEWTWLPDSDMNTDKILILEGKADFPCSYASLMV